MSGRLQRALLQHRAVEGGLGRVLRREDGSDINTNSEPERCGPTLAGLIFARKAGGLESCLKAQVRVNRVELEEVRRRGRPALRLVDMNEVEIGSAPRSAQGEPAHATKSVDSNTYAHTFRSSSLAEGFSCEGRDPALWTRTASPSTARARAIWFRAELATQRNKIP